MTDTPDDERVIPVIEEQLITETEPVKTGSVKVQKHVQTTLQRVDVPVLRETVDVRHVPVNKVIASMPKIRQAGDTIIVPVVEEEVIVTKRLILKEELHIVRHRTRERITRDVPVSRERAEVQKLDEQGRVVDAPRSDARRDDPPRGRRQAPRSILGR